MPKRKRICRDKEGLTKSQGKLMRFLESLHGLAFTTLELHKHLGMHSEYVRRSLKILQARGFVDARPLRAYVTPGKPTQVWHVTKGRMRLVRIRRER